MYTVVEKDSRDDLVNEVQGLIDQGWTPQGGITVYSWIHTEYGRVETRFSYVQSMVIYLENVDPVIIKRAEMMNKQNQGDNNA